MRLIDADNLKEVSEIQKANFNTIEGVRAWIDNQPTVDEKEIICKAFERVLERLEEEARNYKDGALQKLYFETGVARSISVVKEEGGIE